MNKLKLSGVLISSLLAITVNTATHSADQNNSTQENAGQRTVEPATVTDPLERPVDSKARAAAGAKDKGDYQAKLKRCEGLGSPSERQECADKANKERGQM